MNNCNPPNLKIELNSWEKDSVAIKVKIRVEEKKLSKLEKAIDAIDFDFTHSEHFLIVQTLVGQNKSSIGKEISRFKETVFKSEFNFEITHTKTDLHLSGKTEIEEEITLDEKENRIKLIGNFGGK